MRRSDLIRHSRGFAIFVLATGCTASGVVGILPVGFDGGGPSILAPGCSIQQPAFCESFEAPVGGSERAGPLDSRLWTVARVGEANIGQRFENSWYATQHDRCGEKVTVSPPNDISVCNGRIVESSNDNGHATTLMMQMKRPFDIAGRTGILSFDVSNNSQGPHAAWPEIWYTDEPIPSPFNFFDSWNALPKHGLALRLSGACEANNGACASCPGTSPVARVGLGGVVVVKNAVANDSEAGGTIAFQTLDCVVAARDSSELNHFEVHVSENEVAVFGSNPNDPKSLKKIAIVPNANLSLTRGFISLGDAHNNGNKFGTQGTNTFAWDNIGFDGPVLPKNLSFEIPNSNTPGGEGSISLGYVAPINEGKTFTFKGVTGIEKASRVLLTFNMHAQSNPSGLTYSVNGKAPHDVPLIPANTASWNAVAAPIPKDELAVGTNTVRFLSTTTSVVLGNIDLVLVGGGD